MGSVRNAEDVIQWLQGGALKRIEELAPESDAKGEFPYEIYDILREAGLTAMTVPAEYGGLGFDLPDYCRVLSCIAQGDGSTALTLNMHTSVVRMIQAMGSPEQKDFYLREAVAGKLFASLTSEPSSSLRRGFQVETRATRVDGGYRISGFKYFCSLSTAAAYLFVWTMPEGEEGLDESLLNVLVPTSSGGVSIKNTWNAMAMRGTASNSVAFEDVFVPDDAIIGGPGGAIRHRLLDVFMPGYAALYLGLAEAALNRVVEYAKERRFGDRTPADDPLVQHHVGKMASSVAAARQLTFHAAELAQAQHPDAVLMLNHAKYAASEAARGVSSLALRVMGGRALYLQERLQRIFRDAHVGMIMPPTHDHGLETIGKMTLGFDVSGGFLG